MCGGQLAVNKYVCDKTYGQRYACHGVQIAKGNAYVALVCRRHQHVLEKQY